MKQTNKLLIIAFAIAFIVCCLPQQSWATDTYDYNVGGPFSEIGGSPPVSSVNITLMNGNPKTYNLTGGWIHLIVNSTILYNPTSIRVFLPSGFMRTYVPFANETIYIFVPDANDTTYNVDIIDLIGIKNGYLESYVVLNDTEFTVERQQVKTSSKIPFVLKQYGDYGFKLTCEQGIYDFGNGYVPGDPTETIPLTVSALSFPSTAITHGNLTLSATRISGVAIQVLYNDTGLNTNQVNITLTDAMTSDVEYTVSYNAPYSYSVSMTYSHAIQSRDYLATISINNTGYGLLTWIIPCVYMISRGNPFDLGFLGSWPVSGLATQIVGFAIVMCVFACFSLKDHVIGLFISIIVGGLLTWMGFLAIDLTIFTSVFCFAIMYALSRRRPS